LSLSIGLTAALLQAGVQGQTFSGNTVVRFEITTEGTNFGTIDLELFAYEKPTTVQNFMRYVDSGVYSNLVIHRVSSNFVMHAGHVRVLDPTSVEPFRGYSLGTNFGIITNESKVRTQYSNVYGTIGMARIPGQTNSASSDWFINLANNSTLDSVDGGFAVFGRVIGMGGANEGTNILNYFRNVPEVASVLTLYPFDYFAELPFTQRYLYTTNFVGTNFVVETNSASELQIRDLFTVNASLLRRASPCQPIAWTSPNLNCQCVGQNVLLSWQNPTTNAAPCDSSAFFVLQEAPSLTSPPQWRYLSSSSPVVIEITNRTAFYRLHLDQ
jgi:cyclophilin family peptidyl-prolyl cis-trans isomerase